MKITIAHSPDSDDAFMFYGLASGAVSAPGLEVGQVLADIETLNRAAFEGRYEVTAVSFHAYAYVYDRYALLPHGASMGDRYGPVVVTRSGGGPCTPPSAVARGGPNAPLRSGARADEPRSLKGVRVAIPGTLTTAFLALRLFEPHVEYEVMPFDQIQDAVREGRAAAGLLIHEGQLTYADEGLQKIVDLGEWFANRTGGLPLPLGGNVIRRDLGIDTMRRVSRLLHDSIAYALAHRAEAITYAQQFGRGLDRATTDRFVGMYVNDLTLAYGERGRAGLDWLMEEAYRRGLIPKRVPVEFVE